MHLTDASFCYQRQDAVVNKLLNHDGVEVNAKDYRGRSAFVWVSYRGSPRAIRMFLKHEGLDVNAIGGAHGNTALMWACLRGQAEIVSELLALPMVDVHSKNKAGSTALNIARGLEMFEITRLLEEHIMQNMHGIILPDDHQSVWLDSHLMNDNLDASDNHFTRHVTRVFGWMNRWFTIRE